jgi:hypothetical protein
VILKNFLSILNGKFDQGEKIHSIYYYFNFINKAEDLELKYIHKFEVE